MPATIPSKVNGTVADPFAGTLAAADPVESWAPVPSRPANAAAVNTSFPAGADTATLQLKKSPVDGAAWQSPVFGNVFTIAGVWPVAALPFSDASTIESDCIARDASCRDLACDALGVRGTRNVNVTFPRVVPRAPS
jgi:hypothetical protein